MGGSVVDAESGETLEAGVVVRGTTRIETVRFKTTMDLKDLERVCVVKVAFMNFTDKLPMGNFDAREEPYEFTFPEKLVPRSSPGGTYKIQLSFVAANVAEPLYLENSKFR